MRGLSTPRGRWASVWGIKPVFRRSRESGSPGAFRGHLFFNHISAVIGNGSSGAGRNYSKGGAQISKKGYFAGVRNNQTQRSIRPGRGWLLAAVAGASVAAGAQSIPVTDNFWRLVAQEDTDGDQKITVHDRTTPFVIRDGQGAPERTLTNFYEMSVLLQELKRAADQHASETRMEALPLDEAALDRTHRCIRDYYWNALTRRIDAAHLDEVIRDSKTTAKYDYLYVPAGDPAAIRYFGGIEKADLRRGRWPALKVVVLPPTEKLDGIWARSLDGAHGLLSLKLEWNTNGEAAGAPYVAPGGRFNELYYWDSYFIVLGLVQDGRRDLAQGMADNLLYEVEFYGKAPNANRTYYLTRSQPPFLTSIVRAVYEAGGPNKAWLAAALKTTLAEYRNVWRGPARRVLIGPHELSRYYDEGDGPCVEVEPGHYDEKIQPWLAQAPKGDGAWPLTPYRFLNQYLYCGRYGDLRAGGQTLEQFFKDDRALRESGHDTTHRFDDRTADFTPVDLNSLLYKYERDFAELIESEFGGDLPELGNEYRKAESWRARAARRKAAMLELMWDERRGYFFDYDFANRRRSEYISATGLWPLWAKVLDPAAGGDRDRARRTAAFAFAKLEEAGGLAATARESVQAARRQDERQWDYPYGWAPHQMLAWEGLKNYGMAGDAARLAYRWIYTITKNAHDYNGMIPEKYNVVTGSHEVFAEYGNVGTKFAYVATEGFGWMNASFEAGLTYMTSGQLAALRRLEPPR